MPKFKVDTNAGSFEVELDRPPTSHAELMQSIEERLNSQGGTAPAESLLSPQDIAAKTSGGKGFAPAPKPTSMPIPGPFETMAPLMEAVQTPFRKASEFIDTHVGEPARKSLQEDFGLSPNAAAAIATGLTLPARGLMEIGGLPTAINTIQKVAGAAQRKIGGVLSRSAPVAFQRRQNAIEDIKHSPEQLKPATPASELYNQVGEINPQVPLDQLKPIIKTLKKEESLAANTGLEHPDTVGILNKLNNKFFKKGTITETSPILDEFGSPIIHILEETGTGKAPFDQVRLLMKRLNERIGGLKSQGGQELGDAMQLKKGFIRSLNEASNGQVGPEWAKLRTANKAFQQEIAHEEITNIIDKNIRTLEGRLEANAQNVSAGRALDQFKKFLKDEPDLAASLDPQAIERIANGLERLRRLPLFGAPPGVDAGSKNMLGKLFLSGATGGTIGGTIGGALGGSTGAAIGSGLGSMGTYATADMIARALAKPKGIDLVERLLTASNGNQLTLPQMAVLQGFVKASEAQGGQ
jgi:hypothetical protein